MEIWLFYSVEIESSNKCKNMKNQILKTFYFGDFSDFPIPSPIFLHFKKYPSVSHGNLTFLHHWR